MPCVAIGLAVVVSTGLGLAWSFWYWGYPLWPHSPTVEELGVSFVHRLEFLDFRPPANGPSTPEGFLVRDLNDADRHPQADACLVDLLGGIPMSAPEGGFLASSSGVRLSTSGWSSRARECVQAIVESGGFVDPSPGSRQLVPSHGLAISYRARDGSDRVFARLSTWSNSRGQYVCRQFTLSLSSAGSAVERTWTHYFDIGGIEGVEWWMISLVVLVPGTCALILILMLLPKCRRDDPTLPTDSP